MRLSLAEFEELNRAADEAIFGGVVECGPADDPADAVRRQLVAAGVTPWLAELLDPVAEELAAEYGADKTLAFLLGSVGKAAPPP